MTHWILIADASDAKIYSMSGPNKPLELVREISNPQGRLLTQELVTDGPGRFNKSGSPGTRSAADPDTTAHEEVAREFARKLAAILRQEAERNSYHSLSIAASAHFLGILRELLAKDVEQRLRATLPRDLKNIPAAQLRSHIDALLPAGVFI